MKFIVFEGLDCSGKTTLINKLMRKIPNTVYSKGIGNNDFIGKIARKLHSTIGFCFELIIKTYFQIIPILKDGKIVLQDRYFFSVASYLPKSNLFYNRMILKLTKLFLLKPDAYVYLTLPKNERLKRLIEKGSYYELYLARNQYLIDIRERFYEEIFYNEKCPKIKINTYYNEIDDCINLLRKFLS